MNHILSYDLQNLNLLFVWGQNTCYNTQDVISHAIDDMKEGSNFVSHPIQYYDVQSVNTFPIRTKPTILRLFTEVLSDYTRKPTRSIFQPFKTGSPPSTQQPTVAAKKDLDKKTSLFETLFSMHSAEKEAKSDIQEVMNKLGVELDDGKWVIGTVDN